MTLRAIFSAADEPAPQPWLDALEAAVPGLHIVADDGGRHEAEVAVVWKPPADFFDRTTGLRWVFNLGAGVDALLARPLPAGLRVLRLEDAGMAAQMAEYVLHAVVDITRCNADYRQQQRERRWQVQPAVHRHEWPIGVLGLGEMGGRVARTLVSLDWPVLGWSRTPRALDGIACHHGPSGLAAVLAGSRILVNVLPLTPDTHDLLNRRTLSQLPRGAWLINVARGAHVVEDDLLALLDDGHLGGAWLDVFRTEPLPAGHPFWTHPHVVVTPHVSARTLREPTVRQIAQGLQAILDGRAPAGEVDRQRGY